MITDEVIAETVNELENSLELLRHKLEALYLRTRAGEDCEEEVLILIERVGAGRN